MSSPASPLSPSNHYKEHPVVECTQAIIIPINRRRVRGGILATIGFILSPLSWWNDLLVNIPLAYVFATIVGLVSRQLFVPALILGYWITNILGFVLLHIGAEDIRTGEETPYTKRDLVRDLLLSVGYTLLVVFLVHIDWLTFPGELFS